MSAAMTPLEAMKVVQATFKPKAEPAKSACAVLAQMLLELENQTPEEGIQECEETLQGLGQTVLAYVHHADVIGHWAELAEPEPRQPFEVGQAIQQAMQDVAVPEDFGSWYVKVLDRAVEILRN